MSRIENRVSRRAFVAGTSAAVVSASSLSRAIAALPALKVGVIHPTSGFLAQIGQTCNRGAAVSPDLLQEWGYPRLDIVYGDTESNPDTSRAAGNRLIEAGAQILVGAFDSGQTTTLAQVAEYRGIPLVIDIAAAPQITEQGYKFVFRNWPLPRESITGALNVHKQIFETSGKTPKTAVFLHRNDTFGTAISKAFDANASKVGVPYKIVKFIAYDPQARDLSIEVGAAKETRADIAITATGTNDAIALTREMVKQRWSPWGVLSAGPGWYDQAYRKALGKFGDYAITTVPWYDPTKARTKMMLVALERKFPGVSVDPISISTAEALLIVADAYKRAGSAAPQALAEALRTTNIPAADSLTLGNPKGISFDSHGQVSGIPVAGIQNLNGIARVVLPASSAEAKLVFPQPAWQDRT